MMLAIVADALQIIVFPIFIEIFIEGALARVSGNPDWIMQMIEQM